MVGISSSPVLARSRDKREVGRITWGEIIGPRGLSRRLRCSRLGKDENTLLSRLRIRLLSSLRLTTDVSDWKIPLCTSPSRL